MVGTPSLPPSLLLWCPVRPSLPEQRGDYPSNLYNLELCLRSRQWRVVVVDPPHPAFVFRSTMGFCAHAFVQDPQPRESASQQTRGRGEGGVNAAGHSRI